MVSIFIVLSIDVYFLSTWGLRTIGRGVESRKGINNLLYLGHKKSDRLVSIYSWVRSTRISIYFGFDLHKIPISNCPLFDLHEFWSAQFSICTVFALQFLDLQRFRSAQYSICTDFDLHGFRSTCISICKSILDLWIFRSANQISIYRFFDLQIKFRSTDFSICKSSFDLQIVWSANHISI